LAQWIFPEYVFESLVLVLMLVGLKILDK
jgi:hypothetical protein